MVFEPAWIVRIIKSLFKDALVKAVMDPKIVKVDLILQIFWYRNFGFGNVQIGTPIATGCQFISATKGERDTLVDIVFDNGVNHFVLLMLVIILY